ncbi:Wzz/FepE/Etk N-terminal domain-containing protein [Aliiglaciecola sp. LCG003]|uniref:Wzz/FepE/Etk N-terminal domain-containing protein n=1 Tax=Aliiglaciecola sp. LCG003 TaxID=3053655 RepID=UPI0025746B9F|nr:Wzz/FepE/Etk N-terminal domain-containing protein [Aliiglaciecola sp. LCG003]WJG10398.1 Wzz/FepE/Etk N-terminal domain-containing protein [Aliiglaciecola sp. LCG003]
MDSNNKDVQYILVPQEQMPESSKVDEINLLEIWNIVLKGKWLIILMTVFFAVCSVLYALSIPNSYKSEMLLVPSQNDGKGSLGGLASQFGGLASLAGVNLGGNESSRIDQAVERLISWPFLNKFVADHNLKAIIVAVKGWDASKNELIYNEDIYNPETKAWIGNNEPTSWKTYRKLKTMLSISNDPKTGMLTIAVEHYSPQIAYEWVNLLKADINLLYQQYDMQESRKNIEYLKSKIETTNINEMKSVFYNMIEAQTQTLMLAEVSDEYLIKTVVPAMVAEEKSKPRRAFMCILGTLMGFILGLLIIFIRHFFKK